MKTEKILVYGTLFIALLVLFWSVSSLSSGHTTEKYEAALESELSDKCITPEGYTDEQWKEHMSHHPDRYAECLG